MKFSVVDHDGLEHEIEGQAGRSLMEIVSAADMEIAAQCGGSCSCATCHVYVDPEWFRRLPPPDENEAAMLEFAADVQDFSRLSCQITAASELDGMRIQLAPGTRA